MKILSVVTLVSPDGAYGGPLRVALNQAAALRARGHEVTLTAGYRGMADPPATLADGVGAKLFPARRVVPRTGFAGLAAPGMLRWLAGAARSYDVVHVHLARDLVTLPAAALLRARGVPYVAQTHGMIDPSSHPLARLLDPTLTLPVLRSAGAVFYLTSTERDALERVAGDTSALRQLGNGVPESDLRADPEAREVLFLARLAARKRPGLMVPVAESLLEHHPDVRVRLVGPDEGEARALEQAMGRTAADIAWEGPLPPETTLARMSRAGLYVLPSIDEPYCMTVLEAMSIGLPVVITESNGLASLVRRHGAGVVSATDTQSIVEAVGSVLSQPDLAREMSAGGLRATSAELSMDAVAQILEQTYTAVGSRSGSAAG